MKSCIVSVSRRLPAWAEAGEYLKRMNAACPVVVKEVPQVERTRGVSAQACLEKERRAVLAATSARSTGEAGADESWSFSKWLMLIEQLCRGWSLPSGSSYHRE